MDDRVEVFVALALKFLQNLLDDPRCDMTASEGNGAGTEGCPDPERETY